MRCISIVRFLYFKIIIIIIIIIIVMRIITEIFSMTYQKHIFLQDNVKGKAIPLKAWTGSEGYGRLRFPDFKTISTRMR